MLDGASCPAKIDASRFGSGAGGKELFVDKTLGNWLLFFVKIVFLSKIAVWFLINLSFEDSVVKRQLSLHKWMRSYSDFSWANSSAIL